MKRQHGYANGNNLNRLYQLIFNFYLKKLGARSEGDSSDSQIIAAKIGAWATILAAVLALVGSIIVGIITLLFDKPIVVNINILQEPTIITATPLPPTQEPTIITATPLPTSTDTSSPTPLPTLTNTSIPPTRIPTLTPTRVPSRVPTTVPRAEPRELSTTVQAFSDWQNTGIYVSAGQTLRITATGTWSHGIEGVCCGPNPFDANGYRDKYDPHALLPAQRVGSLIGRIGNGGYFFVGTDFQITSTQSGNLQLIINDVIGSFGDNSGELAVNIRVE
jgi:hypothetical protein